VIPIRRLANVVIPIQIPRSTTLRFRVSTRRSTNVPSGRRAWFRNVSREYFGVLASGGPYRELLLQICLFCFHAVGHRGLTHRIRVSLYAVRSWIVLEWLRNRKTDRGIVIRGLRGRKIWICTRHGSVWHVATSMYFLITA